MEDNHFEKRMAFLKKSYERIPSTFDQDEVLQKIEDESTKPRIVQSPKKYEKLKQKATLWLVSIASLFIIGIISAPYLFERDEEDEKGTEITADLIEDLKANYAIEREKRRDALKLDEKTFSELAFIQSADGYFSFVVDTNYIERENKRVNGEKMLMDDINIALSKLKLPSEMAAEIKKNSLVNDEQASIAFLSLYREKVKNLIEVYNTILADNREVVQNYKVDPLVDKAEVMMLSSEFPEQLQNIIDTMKEQSISLVTNTYSGEIEARYYDSYTHTELKNSLAYITYAYADMIVQEPYMFDAILKGHLEETVQTIDNMQYTLMNVERDSTLYPTMESYFTMLFIEIMKGSEFTKIFDDQGVLKVEYKEAWEIIATGNGDVTPLRYVVQPIVEEMKASGWRQSAKLEALNYGDIKDALVLYREGQLEYFMYGDRPDFQDETINLPDASFENEVHSLYTAFKKSYDKSVFEGISPIHVVGVFNYANEIDDPETMYHLFHKNVSDHSETGFTWTSEWYIKNWRKGFSLFRDVTQLEFNAETINRYQQTFYGSVGIMVDGEIHRGVNLIYDENEIWEMQETWLEILPSYDEHPEIAIALENIEHVRKVYKQFSKTKNTMDLSGQQALTIVGLYFYAGEIGDYATQYELFYQGEGYEIVNKDTYLNEAPSHFLPYSEAMYKTMSFKGQEQDADGNWPGIAKLTVDTDKFPDEKQVKEFKMMWTEYGWRVVFDPIK